MKSERDIVDINRAMQQLRSMGRRQCSICHNVYCIRPEHAALPLAVLETMLIVLCLPFYASPEGAYDLQLVRDLQDMLDQVTEKGERSFEKDMN